MGSIRDGGCAHARNLAQSYSLPIFTLGDPYFNGINSWYSQYSNYSYFFDLYYNQATRSKQEADEFESSLAREGKLTGPAEVGAFPTDFLPLRSHDVEVTLDGQVQEPSPGGDPLVLGSGRHTLHIGSR